MTKHKVYSQIIRAKTTGQLLEPFGIADFRLVCPGLGEGTYQAFLYKHRLGNSGGNSELFELVAPRKFRLIHPYKYGLQD